MTKRFGMMMAAILAASFAQPPPVRTYRAKERDPEPNPEERPDFRAPKTHPTRITKRQARRLKGKGQLRRIID